MDRLLAALLLTSLAGCATGLPTGARSTAFRRQGPIGPPAFARAIPQVSDIDGAPAASLHGGREDVVKLAQSLIGRSKVTVDGRTYPDDCTGLVSAVFDRVGVP